MSDHGWCLNCLEEFRLDDTGGYNPPCKCGARCRSCCDAQCDETLYAATSPTTARVVEGPTPELAIHELQCAVADLRRRADVERDDHYEDRARRLEREADDLDASTQELIRRLATAEARVRELTLTQREATALLRIGVEREDSFVVECSGMDFSRAIAKLRRAASETPERTET